MQIAAVAQLRPLRADTQNKSPIVGAVSFEFLEGGHLVEQSNDWKAGYKRPSESWLYPAPRTHGKSQGSVVSAKADPSFAVVGRNICRLRSERGITQERVCELADVDRGYFQRVEAGKQNMTVEYLERMRKALKCNWSDLFRGLDDG